MYEWLQLPTHFEIKRKLFWQCCGIIPIMLHGLDIGPKFRMYTLIVINFAISFLIKKTSIFYADCLLFKPFFPKTEIYWVRIYSEKRLLLFFISNENIPGNLSQPCDVNVAWMLSYLRLSEWKQRTNEN